MARTLLFAVGLLCWTGLSGQTLSLDTLPPRSTHSIYPPVAPHYIYPPVAPIHYLPEAAVVGAAPNESMQAADAAHAVTSLLPREIQHVGTPALAPALEAVTGLDIRTRGPLGVQSDLSIRGGTFEQAALYVDGIRWSAPQTAHHLLNLPIEPSLLSGLEVVRGGTGAFAGVGAFAGSLHLSLAPDPLNPFTQIDLEGGSYGWRRAAMSASWNAPGLIQRVAVSHSTTDGYQENTDAMITRAMWIGDWTGKHQGRWRALLGFEEKAFGAQSFYTAAYPHQFEATGSAMAQLTWRRFARWESFAGFHARYHRDRFELYREGPAWYEETADGLFVRDGVGGVPADTAAFWYGGPNQHRSFTSGLTARTTHHHGRGRLTLGADSRIEAVRSNVLGVARDSVSDFPLGAERVNTDLFASERWLSGDGQLRVSATLGANLNTQFGARVLPALDAVYRFGSNRGEIMHPWAAFASIGRSVRHPSYTDLYYQGGASGRADLQPEVADQIELGLRWRQRRVLHTQLAAPRPLTGMGVELAGWLRRGSDLIDWVLLPGSDEFQAANLTTTVHRGIEVAADYQVEPSHPLFFQSVRASFAATDAAVEQGDYESSYALDIVRSKADLLATFLFPGRLVLEVRATRQARSGQYRTVEGEVTDYAPFTVAGLGLSRSFFQGQLRGFVRADNAFNAEYVDFGNVLQPGRWWRAGITWRPKRGTEETP